VELAGGDEEYDVSGISEVSLCSKIGKTLLSLYSYKRAVKFFQESIEQTRDGGRAEADENEGIAGGLVGIFCFNSFEDYICFFCYLL
jgi:hypothetical protein